MKKQEHKLHNSNFMDACNNAVNGIIYAATTQSNIKKQLMIAIIVMILSLFFPLSKIEFLCLLFAVVLVILAEMLNTAIETLVDLYVDCYHPKAKIAKDVGAGAVLLTAFNAVIVAYFLFFEKIEQVGNSVLETVVNSPTHTIFVALILVIILMIALKAAAGTNKYKSINKKFIPSGQSAIAFAIATAIWLTTKSMLAFTLALILSLLLVTNRMEKGNKKLGEVIFSSCMGVLIVIMIYALIYNI